MQSQLQQTLTDGYFNFHNRDGIGRLSRSQRIENEEYTFQTAGEEPSDRSATVEEQIKQLPDVVRIPFEQAVSDVALEGWEDEWFSSATFDRERYGDLHEPKIDFVYNCKCCYVLSRQC